MTNTQHEMQATVGSSTGLKPVITKPTHDNKEVQIVAATVIILATAIAGYWFYSEQSKMGSVSNSMSGSTILVSTTPESPLKTEILQADVYFDFSRSRLSDEAKAILQEQANILKKQSNWALLLQGYTDQRGPAEFNKALGLRRAEAVKQYLVGLGLSDASIKVVSLGKDGVICDEDSKECRQRNRRVHLQLVKGVAQKVQPAPVHSPNEEKHPEISEHTDAGSDKPDQAISMDSRKGSSPSQ